MKKQFSGEKPGDKRKKNPTERKSSPKKNTSSGSKPSRGFRKFDGDDKGPKKEGKPSRRDDRKEYEGKKSFDKKPVRKKDYDNDGPKKSFDKKPVRRKDYDDDSPKKSSGKQFFDKKPVRKKDYDNDGPKKSFDKKPVRRGNYDNDSPEKSSDKQFFDSKPARRKEYDSDSPRKSFDKKPFDKKPFDKKPGRKTYGARDEGGKKSYGNKKSYGDRYEKKGKSYGKSRKSKDEGGEKDGSIRLNKYLSNAGICSRREADTYIESGVVSVNGLVITEMGYKVQPGDKVSFGGKTIKAEKFYYVLLNKPKDYITTSSDPQNRKTVMDLVEGAVPVKLFAVGRLDRNTTGVLLLTNDGDMADKLMHPRKNIQKLYKVELDKNFSPNHMQKLVDGVELEDGFFHPDEVSYVAGESKKIVGVRIHSGRNRIVRRLFEHFGYKVIKLDRVMYAGLDKKGLTRGKYRQLTDEEVNILKMI